MADCCTDIGDLKKLCGQTSPILKKAWAVCKDKVDTLPAAVGGEVTAAITFAGTDGFFELEIRNDKSLVAEPQGDASSRSYNTTLIGHINAVTGGRSHIVNGYGGGEFIVVVEDKNGKKFIIGDLDEGAECAPTMRIDGEKNGYDLEFTHNAASLPPEYVDGTITPDTAA